MVSLVAYFIVPTWSHEAKFVSLYYILTVVPYTYPSTPFQLSEEERSRLLERLQADSDAGSNQPFQWSSVRSAFEDHLVWAYAFLFHGYAFVLYSLSLFLVGYLNSLIHKNTDLISAYHYSRPRI
jgi:hypothetical protein